MGPLEGQVALVAGATRGAGRGIACMLGAAGATVWCTGRSTTGRPSPMGRPETIEETADLVRAQGGQAVAVRVDHTVEDEVADLVRRIQEEHGRLDVLVNDIWGGDSMTDWSAKFWSIDVASARALIDQALVSHLITARHAAPLMLERGRGLIVEVTDGEFSGYRGQILYDLVKASVIRIAYAMAWDLVGTGVTALGLTPGFLRSEAVLDHYGVSEANWRDAAARDPDFAESETPFFIGRAVAAIAADPDVGRHAGLTLHGGDLADIYGFDDIDGRRPHFWRSMDVLLDRALAVGAPLDDRMRMLASARYGHIHREPGDHARAAALAAALDLSGLGGGLKPFGPA